MKTINIKTKGKLLKSLVDREDFSWLNDLKWTWNGKYAVLPHFPLYLHNAVLMAYDVNLKDGLVTDHINRNRLDCRKKNLRRITRQQNTWNRTKQQRNNYIGVVQCGRKYAAITKHRYVYYGDSEVEAAKAYDKAVLNERGEFAVTNF